MIKYYEYYDCGSFLKNPFKFVQDVFTSILDGVGSSLEKKLLKVFTDLIKYTKQTIQFILDGIIYRFEIVYTTIMSIVNSTGSVITNNIIDIKSNVENKITKTDNSINTKIDSTYNYFIVNIKKMFGIESELNVIIVKIIIICFCYILFLVVFYIVKIFYNQSLIWHQRQFTFIGNKIYV